METGPRKPLSRKSNYIIEKSSVLSSLLHRHKFTYSICLRWNTVGPICIMLLEGPALLLNPNAMGARKQLLSCRHWQGERPQMDFSSKPLSLPGLLITQGLDPRLTEDPRARKIMNCFLQVTSNSGPRPNVGEQLWFLMLIAGAILSHFPQVNAFLGRFCHIAFANTSLPLAVTHLHIPTGRSARVCLPSCRQPTRNA